MRATRLSRFAKPSAVRAFLRAPLRRSFSASTFRPTTATTPHTSLLRPRPLLLPSINRHLFRNFETKTPVFQRKAEHVVPSTKPVRTSLSFTVSHKPGSLQRVLQFFWKHDVNMSRLESRPQQRSNDFDFYVCVEGSSDTPHLKALIDDLEGSDACANVHLMNSARVPWFPTRVQDVDEFANEILDAGADLQSDHPGFHDPTYRARRQELAHIAINFKHGQTFPTIKYTPDEISTWGAVWDKLVPLLYKHGCKEHVQLLPALMKDCGYSRNNIPQTSDISSFLKERTGFVLRPVAGLLSARHFLYGLAFRVFFSTQYIRHHSKPLYTPEPDIVHELMGHAPLFADPDFADFSQQIGLASIGASDEQILQLARCYWYSVEFGLCQEGSDMKAYGAGLLSSFGELEYAFSGKPEIRPWDPFEAAKHDYPITTYQPVYYLAKNFESAKRTMVDFAAAMSKPFYVRYNDVNQMIEVDRDVKLDPPPKKKK